MCRQDLNFSFSYIRIPVDGLAMLDPTPVERPGPEGDASGSGARQPLDLDLPERRIVLDDEGQVRSVAFKDRLDAHRLIEEFMIQANVSAAETLEARKSPLLFRVHDAPSPEKVDALAEFLATLDMSVPKGQVMKPQHFNSILAKVRGGPNEELVSQTVLRTQSQAIYTPENHGHFGLNLRRYAHFTSPIRRYADLEWAG